MVKIQVFCDVKYFNVTRKKQELAVQIIASTGQAFLQMPHPVHLSSTNNTGYAFFKASTSVLVISMQVNGQTCEHTLQAIQIA
jgi:hypothetical protein